MQEPLIIPVTTSKGPAHHWQTRGILAVFWEVSQ